MIQQQRQRVESAVSELIDDMDKTHLRKMQVRLLPAKQAPFNKRFISFAVIFAD